MKDRDERSRGIEILISDSFTIIKPTTPFKLAKHTDIRKRNLSDSCGRSDWVRTILVDVPIMSVFNSDLFLLTPTLWVRIYFFLKKNSFVHGGSPEGVYKYLVEKQDDQLYKMLHEVSTHFTGRDQHGH